VTARSARPGRKYRTSTGRRYGGDVSETLAELTRVRTQEEEEQTLLSVCQDEEIPTTDFNVGSAIRIMLKAVSRALSSQSSLVASIVEGGFPSLAAAMKDANGAPLKAWIYLIARQFYGLEPALATYTRQRCVVLCSFGAGPQTVNPGFIARNPKTGNRYLYNGAPVVVPDGIDINTPGSNVVILDAEFPGAKFADAAGTIVDLVTPLPGLSISNAETDFGGLDEAGNALAGPGNNGTGFVTPSAATKPIQRRQYTITVRESGAAGSSGIIDVEWMQAGVAFKNTVSPIPATYTGVGDNVELAFDDGPGTGWISGDVHTFQTPGTPILVQGQDDETNASVLRRCLGRWPDLGDIVGPDKVEKWIFKRSRDSGLGIEKVAIRPSSVVAGQIDVVVATASGGIGVTTAVAGAENLELTLTGTVTVKNTELLTVQAKADELWAAYVRDLPIGGDVRTGYPGVARLSELEQQLMDAGAIDVTGLQLNGAPANRTLAYNENAIIPAGQEPSAALTWHGVA
jgi:hypothetical protein